MLEKISAILIGMQGLKKSLKVYIRNSLGLKKTEISNLLGFVALLYQADIENKQRDKAANEAKDKKM